MTYKHELSDAERRLQIDKAVTEDMRQLRERYVDINPANRMFWFLIRACFIWIMVIIAIIISVRWWLK